MLFFTVAVPLSNGNFLFFLLTCIVYQAEWFRVQIWSESFVMAQGVCTTLISLYEEVKPAISVAIVSNIAVSSLLLARLCYLYINIYMLFHNVELISNVAPHNFKTLSNHIYLYPDNVSKLKMLY